MQKNIAISVIIPTYKRPAFVLKILASLQKQTLDNFEIILVDNEANGAVKKMVSIFNTKAKIKARYSAEPILGWHNAAHAGARAALSRLLLFTNDDVIFTNDCLLAYVQAFENFPTMVAGGGPIRPQYERIPPVWLKKIIGNNKIFTPFSLMEPYDEFKLSTKLFFFGANMAIRKKSFFSLGGFNPEDFGSTRLGDGEYGLNKKIRQKGWLIGYIPKALVFHYIPKERMNVESLLHWMRNAGAIDMYTIFHEKGIPKNLWGFYRCIFPFVKINVKYWVGNLFFRSPKASLFLKIKLQFARTNAQIDYIKRLMHDKKLQKLVARKNWLSRYDRLSK